MRKITTFICLTVGIVLVASGQPPANQYTLLINQGFGAGAVDRRIWNPSTPFSDSQMFVLNDAAIFVNRGRLLTTFDLPERYIVEGKFALLGSSYGQFSVFLRTDGLANNPSASFQTGIVAEFQIHRGDWLPAGINNIHLFEENGSRIEASFPLQLNILYPFKIIDDGKSVTLYLNNQDTPLLTLNSAKRAGYRLGFQNREGAGGNSFISAGSKAELASLTVNAETGENGNVYGYPATELQVVKPPKDPIDPKTGLPLSESDAPTNNFIEIDDGTGEVRVLDTNGLVIETTNFQYLPRIQIADLSKGALLALLDNKTAYDALTKFGNLKGRVVESENFESKMREIWDGQNSLNDKIETRLIILKEMKDYNMAASDYRGKIGVVNSIEQAANNASVNAGYAALGEFANDYVAHNISFDGTRETAHSIMTARSQQATINKNTFDAANEALGVANYANGIKEVIEKDAEACRIHAQNLAIYGINVSSSSPFDYIPPLSLRYEVELERASN